MAIVTTTTSCFKFQHATRLVAIGYLVLAVSKASVRQAGFSVDLHIASGIFFLY